MHFTFGYLLAKPQDFKICLRCNRINWYENKECIDCGNPTFREANAEDIEKLVEAWKASGHFCLDCEIDA